MQQGFLITSILLFLIVMSPITVLAQEWPTVEGTFVQAWFVSRWSDFEWQKEFAALKEAGIKYLIISPAVQGNDGLDQAIYPSDLPGVKWQSGYVDVLDACLRNAEEAGIKVFVGINTDSGWWNYYGTNPEWLYGRMHFGNEVAQELWETYRLRYPNAFYGWYWDWEVDNYHFASPESQAVLANALNITLDYLKEHEMDLPLLFSPFINHKLGTADHSGQMWKNIFAQTNFREGDIFAPQDSIGAGGLTLAVLADYFEELRAAVDTKPGLKFWSNAESFWQADWSTVLLDRFVEQLEIAAKYAENFITFAYSHYLSPNNVDPNYHKYYTEYAKTGKIPEENPAPPSNLTASLVEDGIRLNWEEAEGAGYLIFRDGRSISRLLRGPQNQRLSIYRDRAVVEGRTYEYEIRTVGYTGVISEESVRCTVTFE